MPACSYNAMTYPSLVASICSREDCYICELLLKALLFTLYMQVVLDMYYICTSKHIMGFPSNPLASLYLIGLCERLPITDVLTYFLETCCTRVVMDM